MNASPNDFFTARVSSLEMPTARLYCLLSSDLLADRAGASMGVAAGKFADPGGTAGLALSRAHASPRDAPVPGRGRFQRPPGAAGLRR